MVFQRQFTIDDYRLLNQNSLFTPEQNKHKRQHNNHLTENLGKKKQMSAQSLCNIKHSIRVEVSPLF